MLAGPSAPRPVYVTVGKGLAVDSAGAVYFTDTYWRTVRKINRDGTITEVTGLDAVSPDALTVDPAGNLYVGDSTRKTVKRVAADSGAVTLVAGNGTSTYAGDGTAATSTGFFFLSSIAADAGSGVFISDGARIYRVDLGSGKVARFSGGGSAVNYPGDGKPATSVFLTGASSLVLSPLGDLIFLQGPSLVRRVSLESGIITTFAGNIMGTAPDDSDERCRHRSRLDRRRR